MYLKKCTPVGYQYKLEKKRTLWIYFQDLPIIWEGSSGQIIYYRWPSSKQKRIQTVD